MALFEKAHADWPATALIPGGGVAVTGIHEGLGYEDGFVIPALAITAGSVWLGIEAASYAAGFIAFFVGIFCLGRAAIFLFGTRLTVKIYPDRIELPSVTGAKLYSRQVPIEFKYEQHQMAAAEEAKEHRSGKRERKYREALEVVMQYGERRIVIAEMNQKHVDMARALVIRLQDICGKVDLAMAIATGTGGIRPAGGDFGSPPEIR